MPGDKICIGPDHVQKANTLFPHLLKALAQTGKNRAVVSVYGGSGVGKSEIASLLAWRLREVGIGSYVISGDNYPRRIPLYNDAERARVFRSAGLKGLVAEGVYSDAVRETLDRLWEAETGDQNICAFKLRPINVMTEGFGAAGHPSLKSNLRMGEELTARLREHVPFLRGEG